MITPEPTSQPVAVLDDLSTEDFLQVIGQRVRQQRARRSMSRKRLAEVSTVSERYLAQLESGQGNMSIALLRKVTGAIGISLETLMSEQVTETCIKRLTADADQVTPEAPGGPAIDGTSHHVAAFDESPSGTRTSMNGQDRARMDGKTNRDNASVRIAEW